MPDKERYAREKAGLKSPRKSRYRKRGPNNPAMAAFYMPPCPQEELPSALKTRRWRRGDEDWEDRPKEED